MRKLIFFVFRKKRDSYRIDSKLQFLIIYRRYAEKKLLPFLGGLPLAPLPRPLAGAAAGVLIGGPLLADVNVPLALFAGGFLDLGTTRSSNSSNSSTSAFDLFFPPFM